MALLAPQSAFSQVRLPKLPTTENPTPEAIERAKASYNRAAEFYAEGKNKAALMEAKATFKVLPNASSALVLATIYVELEQPCAAFDIALLGLDLDPTPAESQSLDDLLKGQGKACGTGFGWMDLKVSPSSARVRIEETVIPIRRLIGVPAGAYTIELMADGYRSHTIKTQVNAGEPFEYRFDLEKIPAPVKVTTAPVLKPSAAVKEPPSNLRREGHGYQWALIGTGIAAIGVQAVLLSQAHTAADRAAALTAPTAEPSSVRERRYNDEKSKAETLQLTGWVVGSLGVTAATAGLIWLFWDGSEAARAYIVPSVDGQGATMGFGGAF